MDSKAIRTIVILGVIAALALTALMVFSLDQMSDTQTPKIASEIAAELRRSLAGEPPASVKLTMVREGRGPLARRVYTLRLRPSEPVGKDDRALERLIHRAAEMCAARVGEVRSEVAIRCVADLPQGGTKTASYIRDKDLGADSVSLIHLVDEAASAPVPSPPGSDR